MKKYNNIPQVSTKDNHGDACEENYDFFKTGSISGKDSVAYDKGSDVEHEGIGYSIKSSHFTLASAKLIKGEDMTEKLDFYFAHVHSTVFVYITKAHDAYEMTAIEFREFLEVFGTLEKESTKNGGGYKVRCRAESKKMLQWFEARI